MSALNAFAESLPDAARDLRINVGSVMQGGPLSPTQRWGIAVASAIAARCPALRDATIVDATAELGEAAPAVIDDAKAAAALMAMNNVFYRFRHFMGKESYEARPARLRMQRLVKPLGSRVDFELTCLAVSAINGCEACVKAHEKVVLEGGLTEDHVFDAVRIAAVMHGAGANL